MTILFMDGFENYNAIADMAGMWNAGGSPTFQQAGRDAAAGSSIRLHSESHFMSRGFDDINEVIIGFAYRKTAETSVADFFVNWRYPNAAGGSHLRLYVTTANKFQIRRGAAVTLATSSRSIVDNVWYYIEVRVLIHDSAGEAELRVNGKSGGWINATGLDTHNAGSALVDEIYLEGGRNFGGRPHDYDDLYILDPNLGGAPGNTFLGDSIVETLNPSGVGAEAQWTPSAGANHENVDETTPDGDTTFNSSAVVDDDDRFAMDDLVNTPSTVFGVQVQGQFRLENSGARDVRLKVTDGVTEGQSDDKVPTFDSVYVMESFLFEDHPTDANPWSVAEVNAMEAGYRIQA